MKKNNYPFVRILGSEVHVITIPMVVEYISSCIDKARETKLSRTKHIVVSGFHGLWEAHKSTEMKTILNSADLWIPDGIAPVWIARRKGVSDAVRTPGADLMQAFFEMADKNGYSSYFYGDTDETLALLKEKISARFPGHKVAGVFSPPFRPLTDDEDQGIVDRINAAKPDVLWIGLGMPKQDRWIYEHLDRLNVPVAVGVGAAFGFHSGKVKRVPEWIGRHGLEWLWRLACEPKKLWRRSLLNGPCFVFHVMVEALGIRKY